MIDLTGSIEEQRSGQHAEGCVKTESDLERYRLIIAEVHPELIIECGTFSGKSALWFSQFADVITMDTHPQVDEATRREAGQKVLWLRGDSVDPSMVGFCSDCAYQKRTLVILDSDHSAAHVLAELEGYSPLVTPGSYIVVEDGIVRWLPDELAPVGPYEGSPLDAVETFLNSCEDFEIDMGIEDRFPTTQFPSGWLKRLS